MASEQDQVPTKTVTSVSGLPACAGKYRIVGKIGQGGMGVVFRAVDDDLTRTVALKFIPVELDRADAEERFLREARAASALDHVAPKLTSSQATTANYLQTQINYYNNNQPVQCPPGYVY